MIQLFHVYKTYERDTPALVDVSVTVERGEFVFLAGQSGAGKSTLLRLLYAAEQPTAGQILVNNVNIARLGSAGVSAMRREIGVVFQDFRLIPWYTIYDNVALAIEVAGRGRGMIRGRVLAWLEHVGLAHKFRAYPRQLSGGEQQRVAIARAMVIDPILVLADEPTGNLDPEITMDVIALFHEVNARGTTVVFATHDRSILQSHHKRIITLAKGRVME
ncbi:MAG: cell division ATP-binding protein FtsE [Deltaproteobacteria bacterium]|nr:cell division ATP-binding protein FtsE [Deltaproteobacteria bacterium]